MKAYSLDNVGLAFCAFALLMTVLSVFRTRSFIRFFHRREATEADYRNLRIPGSIVFVGLCGLILNTIVQRVFK